MPTETSRPGGSQPTHGSQFDSGPKPAVRLIPTHPLQPVWFWIEASRPMDPNPPIAASSIRSKEDSKGDPEGTPRGTPGHPDLPIAASPRGDPKGDWLQWVGRHCHGGNRGDPKGTPEHPNLPIAASPRGGPKGNWLQWVGRDVEILFEGLSCHRFIFPQARTGCNGHGHHGAVLGSDWDTQEGAAGRWTSTGTVRL